MRRSGGHDRLLRIVLDTNVFLSALLFEGTTSRLVELWKSGKFLCLVTKPIFEEYARTLAYPKFQLTEKEMKAILEDDFLSQAEVVSPAIPPNTPFPKDPADRKFLACALQGKADFLLSGDKGLLRLKKIGRTLIVTPGEFLRLTP